MKKILLLFLVSFIFQSCGFQSRKYTSGHYGHFYKKESVDKGHSLHIDRTSSVGIEFADDSHERHDCDAQVMEHGDQVKLSPEHLSLIKIQKEKNKYLEMQFHPTPLKSICIVPKKRKGHCSHPPTFNLWY